jgi:alpha-D-xyloside xylohydrolase
MKFTEGYWRMRPDATPYFPAQVHEVENDATSLTVYAPTRRINHRGDTLNVATLTVRYSSPMENVIRVQLSHFKGGKPRKPEFQLNISSPAVQIQNEEQFASLTSGRMTVRVNKGQDWRVDFKDGDKPITNSAWRNLGLVDTPDGRFAFEQLGLGVGECVYGLGERFTPFVKNGQVVDIWNGDGGTSSELAYKNIPFYLTNRGYGVFVNHPEMVSFEVASEKVERVQFSVPGETLDYFVIYGPTPKEVLERYTALTGRPALPPAWSFGLWLSTSFVTNYDESTVTGFIQGMAERDIPLHVFHFDCFWMKEFHWVNFEWDKRVFPDPKGMLQRLKERGLKICVWINPYVAQRSAMFDEGMANGYLLKKQDGSGGQGASVWQTDAWQSGMGIVDFTNPAACQWFGDKLRALMDLGVDCFKTDFGEVIPTDVAWFDGSDPQLMHNYYTQLYNKVVFGVLEERLGKGNAIVFARSATAGGQQFPVHWGGDSTATFESMAESLRGGLSLTLSGFGYWSHDIGGFELTASSDVYKRWCAFGLLSSHSRLHGNASYRVPWAYNDPEAVDVLRYFTKLKCRLMPYLFEAALQAHERGIPMMRAMPLEFPNDPGCDTLDRQYMLGDSLLVAPVLSPDCVVDYYLPEGRWTNILSGAAVQGGGWRREQHNYLSLPLLARPNSIIPVGNRDDRPDYDYADGVTLQIYELAEGVHAPVILRATDGSTAATFHVERNGNIVTIQAKGTSKPWQALMVGVPSLSIEGGQVENTAEGILVKAANPTAIVKISL